MRPFTVSSSLLSLTRRTSLVKAALDIERIKRIRNVSAVNSPGVHRGGSDATSHVAHKSRAEPLERFPFYSVFVGFLPSARVY